MRVKVRGRVLRASFFMAVTLLLAGLAGHGLLVVAAGGIATVYSDPSELYVPAEATQIKAASLEGDRLLVTISGAGESGVVESVVEGQLRDRSGVLLFPTPHLAHSASVELRVVDGHLLGASVPFHSAESPTLNYWVGGMLDDEHADDLSGARAELDSLLADTSGLDDLDRLQRLFDHLQERLAGHWGDPPIDSRGKPGLELMRAAQQGLLGVDCTPSSMILAAYANLAGIPTRLVVLMGERGDLHVGRHTMTESWIAKEQRWVASDMVNGIRLYRSASGRPLGVMECIEAWNLAGEAGLRAETTESAKRDPYWAARSYFLRDSDLIYPRPLHRSRSALQKFWVSMWHPKDAWAWDSHELRVRAMLHGLARLSVVAGAFGIACSLALIWRSRRRAR